MHQTMFPLLIVNILENHATKERPLSVTEITEFVNREFWTEEGNLLNFKVTQCGSENKKLFCLERPKG